VSKQEIKVVFIGGAGRSGSTLLDRVLGQGKGFVSVGEMYHIWQRGFIENQLCGCGQPFRSCGFWQEVVNRVSEHVDISEPRAILALEKSVARFRHLPMLVFPSLRPKEFSLMLREYANVLKSFYESIAGAAGSRVIIDSSKLAPHGLVLNEIPGIKVYVVHLVRDSRGVVFSLSRRKFRPEIVSKKVTMPVKSPLRGTAIWMFSNLATLLLAAKSDNYKVVTYESFSEDPKSAVQNIMTWTGEDSDLSFFLEDHRVLLGVDHTVSGNPMRLLVNEAVDIKCDVEWTGRISPIKKGLIKAITLPVSEYLSRLEKRSFQSHLC